MKRRFTNYTCWEPGSVDDVIVVDAPMASDAVFLATHHPMLLSKRQVQDRSDSSSGTVVSQESVLEELLGDIPTGLVFLPVIGESGAGKSRLVKWLFLNLPGSPHRKDVYIRRYDTNLKAVLERILDGLEGEQFDQVRLELSTATNQLSHETAPRQLLDNLAIALTDGKGEQDDPDSAWLCDIWGDTILHDNVYRKLLLREDSVFSRLVTSTLDGTSRGVGEDIAIEWMDLPQRSNSWTTAAQPTKTALAEVGRNTEFRERSVELLNAYLPAAIQRLFGLGGRSLKDVFINARRALQADGMELLLAIEDFSILKGIQGDLLDAIIEPAKRGGELELCPVRAVVAVTSGYFDRLIPDTVRTRAAFASHVYSVDLEYLRDGDGGSISEEEVQEFVARYMSAVRSGRRGLDLQLESTGGQTPDEWQNECPDCPYREICHESFGSTHRFGLYPLNSSALDRIVRSVGGFDPRQILAVMRNILYSEQSALSTGRFPSATFESHIPVIGNVESIDSLVEADIQRLDPGDSERRKVFHKFWAGNPPDVLNLSPVVHEAFSLSLLDVTASPPVVKPVRPQPKSEDDATEELLGDFASRVDRWRDGERMEQQDATRIRGLIHSHVIGYIDWNDEFERRPSPWLDRQGGSFRLTSVSIQNAQGEGGARPEHIFVLRIEPSNDSAVFLRALAYFDEYGHWGFERGSELQRLYLEQIDAWASDLLEFYRLSSEGGTYPDIVLNLVQSLVLGSIVLGVDGIDLSDPATILRGMLTPLERSKSTHRTEWNNLLKACSAGPIAASWDREQMQTELSTRIGAAQGPTGELRGVDTSLVIPIIESFTETLELSNLPGNAPQEFRRSWQAIKDMRDPAIDGEKQHLKDWLMEVGHRVNDSLSARDIGAQVEKVADAAVREGVFGPNSDTNRYAANVRAFSSCDTGVVGQIGRFLDGSQLSISETLQFLSVDRKEELQDIQAFVLFADRMLKRTTANVDQKRNSQSGATETGLTTQLEALLGDVEQLADRARGLT